jgi:putative metal-binding protein
MCACAAVALFLGTSGARAASVTTYPDESTFRAVVGTDVTLETWDDMRQGTRITTQVSGVVFSSPNSSLRNFYPIQVAYSSGAETPSNVLAGGYVRSAGTPPQIIVLGLTTSPRAFAFYLTDQNPAATGVIAKFEFRDGSARSFTIANPHPSEGDPIFFGLLSDQPILRVTLTAGFKKDGKGGYEAFSIDNLMLGEFCTGDTLAPICSAKPVTQDGVFVVSGSATDDQACDTGIASVALASGDVNVTLTTDPAFTPGDPSASFTAFQSDGGLDGRATVVVTDEAGNTCTVPVSFRALPAGPTEGQVLCRGDGFLFEVSNDNTTPAGDSACIATLPSSTDPPYPPGYEPSPPEDPFACRVLTIASPIAGLTTMVYKKDGTFDPRLRLLFTRSEDGGVTYPPFQDVTASVEPILNIDPDPTRLSGKVKWSPVKVACALQGSVDCSNVDPTFDFDKDGYPLCPSADSGIQADCNDQIGAIHPDALEICNGLDDDCDGLIDEDNPGGGVACAVPDKLGACAVGTTACVDGAIVCRQTTFPTTEVCDGKDNDCDGSTDEGLGTTSCGVGACAVTVQNCVGGVVQVCAPAAPSPEVCDGIDNNCDGHTDENLGSATCGMGACARSVPACVGGVPQTCVPGTPGVEVCDGVDNDCDGQTDEDLGFATCGIGPCTRAVPACVNGVPQTCVPGAPGVEICNGLDDNCDGLVDNAWTFGGYLQPVEADGSGEYHRKQTIPFKFQLTDCSGQYVSTAVATIEVLFYANGVVGTKVKDIASSGQANTDNLYRYDASGHQYIYNLSTLALSINTTYLVRTHLGDGTTHDVLISIIK